jgi:creatinine amidohydrolase
MTDLPLRFDECTWEEIDDLARDTCVLILPVGSTEPHGPHLPLATDVVISEGMAARAARTLRDRGIVALTLPPIAYSVTDFAGGFAGAVSLRLETARDVLVDVLAGLARQGFVRLCIANSHLEPRHVDSIAAAIEAVRDATGVAVAFPDKRRRRWAETLTDEFRSGACHAGQYETSLVLADRPDLVRDDVRSALPPVEASLSTAIRDGKTTFREAGGDRAYFGFPASATADEGQATYDLLARMLVESIEETYGLRDDR